MSGKPTLLAIDQGTTSSRAILFSLGGDVLDVEQIELNLQYPHKGWVEQDALDIWRDTEICVKAVFGRCDVPPLGIGITNQRETTIVWDRASGEPVYNAIVWQDRRSADMCVALKAAGHEGMITGKTGLLLDPYFSASKISWILENVEGARMRAGDGELAFGTVECYLLWRLTGGDVHVSDVTNASRTMLYNVVAQDWDDDLLALFNIPRVMLPEVRDNVSHFGVYEGIPIGGMAGDQQSALIGQGCVRAGMMKATYGTGCFALMHIGGAFKVSEHRLLTTVAYRINGEIAYAVEGSIFTAGAVMQWLRDDLDVIDDTAQSEALARSVADNNEVYFVPAFTGLGAPYWAPDVRAMICGLSRESTRAHVVRAALEAQAYQSLDLLAAMEADGGHAADIIRIDGGLVANEFMCEFLSDMVQRRVEVPRVVESTAWGAAILAGVQVGVFESVDTVADGWHAARHYEPRMDLESRDALYLGWQGAVAMVLR